jgi:hypothetical protein
MSIPSISSSSLYSSAALPQSQPIRKGFQQLTQDLQNGHLAGGPEQGPIARAAPVRFIHPIAVGGPARPIGVVTDAEPGGQASELSAALQSYNAAPQGLQAAQLGNSTSISASLPDIADELSVIG